MGGPCQEALMGAAVMEAGGLFHQSIERQTATPGEPAGAGHTAPSVKHFRQFCFKWLR